MDWRQEKGRKTWFDSDRISVFPNQSPCLMRRPNLSSSLLLHTIVLIVVSWGVDPNEATATGDSITCRCLDWLILNNSLFEEDFVICQKMWRIEKLVWKTRCLPLELWTGIESVKSCSQFFLFPSQVAWVEHRSWGVKKSNARKNDHMNGLWANGNGAGGAERSTYW